MQGSEGMIDRAVLAAARAERGDQFAEDLAYFIEDGAKAADQIEASARACDGHGVVRPAHGMKNDARSLGALPLAALAAEIEAAGYAAVKSYVPLTGIDAKVAMLRPMLERTIAALKAETEEKPSLLRAVSIGIKAMTVR